jgi:CheY-like chemotaxis protein
VVEAARRGADLTRRILAFGSRQVLQVRPLDLAQEILALDKMLRPLIGEHVRIDLALAPGLAPVRADRTQLQQVIVNLVVNARDAMPAGGTIRVATSELHVEEPAALGIEAAASGRYGVLEVSDTGKGMDAATRERIFEPFFTTKAPEQGTGLGLATVYGILRQHRGGIIVDSAPGRGSTFRVYLPSAARIEAPRPTLTPAPQPAAERGGRVIVVEDEASVRAVAVRILRGAGFQVEAMDGPGAALACAARGDPFDLVLTDVVMPDMSGPELVARLRALRPGLRAVFMSGYPAGGARREELLGAADRLVAKPFDHDALVAVVRSALAA